MFLRAVPGWPSWATSLNSCFLLWNSCVPATTCYRIHFIRVRTFTSFRNYDIIHLILHIASMKNNIFFSTNSPAVTNGVKSNGSGCEKFDTCFKCTYEYDGNHEEPLVSNWQDIRCNSFRFFSVFISAFVCVFLSVSHFIFH